VQFPDFLKNIQHAKTSLSFPTDAHVENPKSPRHGKKKLQTPHFSFLEKLLTNHPSVSETDPDQVSCRKNTLDINKP
jgi:hypothetical protein